MNKNLIILRGGDKMLFYIIDAFTDKPFGGNPAGVVIYDNMEDHKMQSLASELKFSETAFVKQIENRTFDIKFFTQNSEVALCGHATIASFGALLDSKYISNNNIYYMNTKSGLLTVSVKDDFIFMTQAAPISGDIIYDTGSIANVLNISTLDIGDTNYDLKPRKISTGLFDIILPVKSKEILYSISPDYKELSNLSRDYNVVGVHAFTLDSDCYTARCRNFAPLVGIDEEAATGTANGALTYYLYINNILKELSTDYTFIQGEKMNRPSKIITRLESSDKVKVLCGGSFSILSKGNLLI